MKKGIGKKRAYTGIFMDNVKTIKHFKARSSKLIWYCQ
jgi:hypothetical protein